MNLLTALMADTDANLFEEIPKYCDEGHYGPFAVGSREIVRAGMDLKYGPTIGWTFRFLPDKIVMEFDQPNLPQSKVCGRTYADVLRLTFYADGRQSGTGALAGMVREKFFSIQVSDA